MVERICPRCKHGNPMDNRFCGQCGCSIEPQSEQPSLVAATGTALAKYVPQVPDEVKQMGKTLAISLAALAAEASLTWLRSDATYPGSPDCRCATV